MADILPRVEAVADEDVEDSWEVLAGAGVDGVETGAGTGIVVMRGRERHWGTAGRCWPMQVCGLDGARGCKGRGRGSGRTHRAQCSGMEEVAWVMLGDNWQVVAAEGGRVWGETLMCI